MKKLVIYSLGLFLGSSLFFTACKKNDTNGSTENTAESQVHSDDQSLLADQTDADPLFIETVVRSFRVRADQLLYPTIPDFDLPVAAVATVADDEIVPQSIPTLFLMLAIEHGG